MLRAGLIGFPSSGKTALFQLLTSAREAPRPAGRQEANVGVSRVPDERLDRLTALFNPKKHVPATVEFADMGGASGGKGGTAALLDVAAFRNADALLHVVRMFRDPSVPHAAGSVDPARDVRTMEDEVILADLGVVERRLERLEKDLKKGGSADLKKEHEILQRCREALEQGKPLRDLDLAGGGHTAAARLSVPVVEAAADCAQSRRGGSAAGGSGHRACGDSGIRAGPTRGRSRSARRSSSRFHSSIPRTRRRSWPISA